MERVAYPGLLILQIEDAQQTQGWLFGRGGECVLYAWGTSRRHPVIQFPHADDPNYSNAAFDKTDLLYLRYVVGGAMQPDGLAIPSLLPSVCTCPDTVMHIACRDQEEKSRYTEIERHDREVQHYAQLRMKTDKQRPGGGPAAGSLGVAKKIDKDKSRCLEEHCAQSIAATRRSDVCETRRAALNTLIDAMQTAAQSAAASCQGLQGSRRTRSAAGRC